jgi:chromate transporter
MAQALLAHSKLFSFSLMSTSPRFSEAFRFWLKLGFISFGGPTGQIAIMHAELVDKRRWISEARFLHALNYCMLLPGPEAQQLATYIGWLLHRTWGGIVAGSLFVLPSAFLLWVLSYMYVSHGDVPWIAAIFYGLKPTVLAVVVAAVIRIGSRVLKNPAMWCIALLSFVAIFFLRAPFPLIILAAGLVGLGGGQLRPDLFVVIKGHGGKGRAVLDDSDDPPAHTRRSWSRAVIVLVAGLALWWGPVLLAALALGPDSTICRMGLFFSKAAMVTFGGAYAVLPYVGQQAVEQYAWLQPGQMLDGLALAESTPGPLIMVLQFVGFVGAWQHPGGMPPLVAATLGAAMTTWVTFLPCFLWIFLGAPHIESLRGNERLTAALSSITAAVVGVVLNLAVWFGLHVLFPAAGRIDGFAVALFAAAFLAMQRFKFDIIPVLAAGAALGLVSMLWT